MNANEVLTAMQYWERVLGHKLAKPAPARSGPQLLRDAETAAFGDRAAVYGPPEVQFAALAAALSALGFSRQQRPDGEHEALRASDVAVFQALAKLSRLQHSPGHRDSWLDIAGYAACGWQTEDES